MCTLRVHGQWGRSTTSVPLRLRRSGTQFAPPESWLNRRSCRLPEAVHQARREQVDIRLPGVVVADALETLPLRAHADRAVEVVLQPDAEVEPGTVRLVAFGRGGTGRSESVGRGRGRLERPGEETDAADQSELLVHRKRADRIEAEAARLVAAVRRHGDQRHSAARRGLEVPEIDVAAFEREVRIELVAGEQLPAGAGVVRAAREAWIEDAAQVRAGAVVRLRLPGACADVPPLGLRLG